MSDSPDAYFARISEALRAAEIHAPCLVVDLERFDANVAYVKSKLNVAGLPLRIVDKSLPCLPMLGRIAAAFGTNRLMSFHLPIATSVLEGLPGSVSLLGKPMPVGGARQVLALAKPGGAASRIVWLIDTDERLAAYEALAESLGMHLQVAFEVDVGLHRGGFATPTALSRALRRVNGSPHLTCRGVMAYEAHIGHVPGLFGGPKRAFEKSKKRFSQFVSRLGIDQRDILNLGGSSTALLYNNHVGANEVSMGSAFVKPADFDVPSLERLRPAAFIATPILKVVDALAPGLDDRTWILQMLGQFPRRGCFLYGGKWMAKPVYPIGMKPLPAIGTSTNQQFMALPDRSPARADDYAFLRPTQSEFMLQQFGPLAVYGDGRIVDRWPVIS